MNICKPYLACFDDINFAKQLFLNGLLSFGAMQEIILFNRLLIKNYFTSMDAELQEIVNDNFWDWI